MIPPCRPPPCDAPDIFHHNRDTRTKAPVTALARRHEDLVFKDAVIIDRHWDKDDIALFSIITVYNIAQNAELGLCQRPVKGQPTLGEDRLGHAALCGQRHITRKHTAIELAPRAAANKISPHRTDEPRQGPDPRPLTHSVRERALLCCKIGNKHIVHIAAMVHHEDNSGAAVNARERISGMMAKAHAIQLAAEKTRKADRKAVVKCCAERGDNLAGVAARTFKRHVFRHTLSARML